MRPFSHFALQALQNEVVSQSSLYSSVLQLKEALFSVASKDDVAMMKLQLEQLDERWGDLPQILNKRLVLLFKRASDNAHLSASVSCVFCLVLFNTTAQGMIIEEMKTTLSVIFEFRMSLDVNRKWYRNTTRNPLIQYITSGHHLECRQ